MATLTFEIWEDRENGAQEMAPVTERSDALRASVSPNAVRVHVFSAASDFEAYRRRNAWNGWGEWKPEPDWAEHFYSAEEADEQRRYLAKRRPD